MKLIKVELNNKSRKGTYWYTRINKRSYYYKAVNPRSLVESWITKQPMLQQLEPKEKRKRWNSTVRDYETRTGKTVVKRKPVTAKDAIKKGKQLEKKRKAKAKKKAKPVPEPKTGIYSETFNILDLMHRPDTILQNIMAQASMPVKTGKAAARIANKYKNKMEYEIQFTGLNPNTNSIETLAKALIHGATPQELRARFGTQLLAKMQEKEAVTGSYLKTVLMGFSKYNLVTYAKTGNINDVRITMRLKI